MRYVFLLVGLLFVAASARVGVLQHSGLVAPKPGDILAILFMLGGFALLGIAQILKELSNLKSGQR
jgi:hypothetical protein